MAEHVRDRLLDYLYEELDDGERREVETHLDACEACQAAYAEIAGTRELMARLPDEAPERGVEFVVQAAEREARLRRERPPGPLARLGSWIARHPVSTSVAVASVAILVVVTVNRTEPGGIAAGPGAAAPATPTATAAAPAEVPAKTQATPQVTAGEDDELKERSLKRFAAPSANAHGARLDGKVAAEDEDASLRARRHALERKRLATIQVIKGREKTRARERSVGARRSRRLQMQAKKKVSDIASAEGASGVVGGIVGGAGSGRAPAGGGIGIGGLGTGGPPARAKAPAPAHHHRARPHVARRAEAPPRAPAGPVAAAAPPPPMAASRGAAEAQDLSARAAAAPVEAPSRRPPERPARLDAAVRALDAHAPKRALALLDALLAGHPQAPWVAEARYQRCRCLVALGKTEEAAKDCRAAEARGGPFAGPARHLLDRLSKGTGRR